MNALGGRMRKALALILVLSPLSLASGQRRPQFLNYSGLHLLPGADEKTTVAELGSRYKSVQKMGMKAPGNIDQYIVEKENHDTVGVVTFKDGTLSKAYLDWTPADATPYAFVEAVQGVVEAMKSDGMCEIQTGTIREPRYLNENSMIVCGQKYIQITAIDSAQFKKIALVYEWIDDRRILPKE
jgi:hypothetical protein